MSHRVWTRAFLCGLGLTLALALLVPGGAGAEGLSEHRLNADFQLRSAAKVRADGARISRVGFDASRWQRVNVPNTVVGALVEAGQLKDPYVGMNLRTFAGMTYPLGKQFDGPIAKSSPYASAFWYRREFALPKRAGHAWWLRLEGINYRANIWLNGRRIASAKQVAGAFRRHELSITDALRDDGANALAIEVFAPRPDDLAFTWVDWNPSPPDKNMGVWDALVLVESGGMRVRHPQVLSRLVGPTFARAELTVSAELENTSDSVLNGRLRGRIGDATFAMPVQLAAHERRRVIFTPEAFPALVVAQPRLWWPYRMGPQNLYTLALSAEVGDQPSDQATLRFGIQEIRSEIDQRGHRLFKVNGQRLLIRGAAWTSDMLLRPKSRERLLRELRYVREMGLNTIRLEGKFESDLLYDLTDELGILVMAGLCCCDQWEKWQDWDAEDREVALLSVRDLLVRLRNHPSVLSWSNASDRLPPAEQERAYLEVARGLDWPKPVLSSASEQLSTVSGSSGIKMRGPYDYVPPSYWLLDTTRGGAFGFSSETSPGASIMALESMEQTFSAREQWPIGGSWRFHAGVEPFSSLDEHILAVDARYGKSQGLEEFVRRSHALSYESERALFEAYARNKYVATGVIHWMLNNAWPSLTWHLYDYYLRPAGAYYGAKKACEPVHVQFSYDDRSVVVVSDQQQALSGLRVSAELFDFALTSRFRQERVLDLPRDGVVRAFTVPQPEGLSTTYFLKLELRDATGARRSENFYWLSTREDAIDWLKGHPHHTPAKEHADLTQLARLPETSLSLSVSGNAANVRQVKVKNEGQALAFQVKLQLVAADTGKEVLPAYWEDNYLGLLPGEERVLTVFSEPSDGPLAVRASAWNAKLIQGSEGERATAAGAATTAGF